MTKQCLAKAPAFDEVKILLLTDGIITQTGQRLAHLCGIAGVKHGGVVRIAKVLQVMGSGQTGDLG